MASLDDRLLLASGGSFYDVAADGTVSPIRVPAMSNPVTDLRLWRRTGHTRERLGVCVPQSHTVLLGEAYTHGPGRGILMTNPSSGASLSTRVGGDPGAFLFPLSLGPGPDGRIYVLDAGNSRVQVFGDDGRYITQWGHKGPAPGEFGFGSGLTAEDFRGSIAVDDQGFIYVADPGNQRIQKFAP